MKRIVILGGGYGGIKAALTLHKKLRKESDVEITLIDRSENHTLLTELHEVAGNRVSDESVLVPLRQIFQYTKVKLVKDSIVDVRLDDNKLISETTEYQYDYLVLAGGSRPNYFGIKGMEEHAFSLWSHADAVRIRDHIREMFVKASQTKDPQARKQMLTLAVCGGGFTGVEMIGELARWKNELCHEYGINKSEVRLLLVEAMDKILSVFPDKLIQNTMRYLAGLGIEVRLQSPIIQVSPEEIVFKNGEAVPTRTLIWAGGVQACDITGKTELALANRGRVQVDEYQQTERPNVYCVGDMACKMPALVESALQTGEIAAENLVADIKGHAKKPLKPNLHGTMVSVGRWWGVAHLMGMQLTGIMAIVMKHLINMHYLWEIGGFELCIRYMKHEFFHEELPRNILEAQFVHQRPLFWLVPLRLYLGYMWLTSGLTKLNDGWLSKVILKAGAVAADGATAASGAADAVTAASGATGGGMSLIYPHTPGWYAWIVNTFIYPNALFAQRMIVITELALGLMFVAGAFTFLAGIVSVVMNINFLLTTGLYDYWYIVASIAVMAGAGQVFGADRIIMPWLMRQWRYVVRNKKLKIWLWS